MCKRVAVATVCAFRVAAILMLVATASCAYLEVGPDAVRPASTSVGGTRLSAAPRFSPPVPKPEPPAMPPGPVETVTGDASGDVAADEPGVHRVRAGETVYGIARQRGVDAYAIIVANKLVAPFDVREGQRLIIPGAGDASTAAASSSTPSHGLDTASRPSAEAAATGAAQTAALPRPAPPLPEPPASAGGFIWPVDGRVVSTFGPKGSGRVNDGINIAAAAGTPVRAAESGVVAYAGNELRGFGNMLLIKHADGWVSAYAHNQELLVVRGDRVHRGQVIARVGSSGGADQPQVHFELRKNKKAVDPLQQLPRPSVSTNRSRDAG
jgi:murein DD-endopeptidase MepM/ murein hydrolase activator NlpD